MSGHLSYIARGTLLDFLNLPRELRDEVYTYLLSIEDTKHDNKRPHLVRHTMDVNYQQIFR